MTDRVPVSVIVEEVLRRLKSPAEKRVLALFSGGLSGAGEAIGQLHQLRRERWAVTSLLTPNAERLFDAHRDALPSIPGQGEADPADAFRAADVVVLAVLTMNTATKIAHGIADNAVTELVRLSILQGKRLVAARDAAAPGNPLYAAPPDAYIRLAEANLAALQAFGVELVSASELYGILLHGARHTPAPQATPNRDVFTRRILDAAMIRQTPPGELLVSSDTLITPMAADLAKERGVRMIQGDRPL